MQPAQGDRSTLMGLPAELRTPIFEAIIPPATLAQRTPCFVVRDAVYAPLRLARHNNSLAILRTNKTLRDEGLRHVYSLCDVEVALVVYDKHRRNFHSEDRIADDLEQLLIWPYITKLALNIRVSTRDSESGVADRLRRIVAALERGRYLKSLLVRLDWPEDRPIPRSFDAAVEVLEGFDVSHVPKEGVSIVIVGDMEDDEKESIESRLEQSMRSG